jgi:hydrogenase nickel incorporation protein HypA/HybF
MHELSIMGNILEIVLDFAGKHGAHRVAKINLQVGEISDLIPEWMQTYFDFVSTDTISEKAVTFPGKGCQKCGAVHRAGADSDSLMRTGASAAIPAVPLDKNRQRSRSSGSSE